MDNLPLAVLTLMVNGKNTGSDDPTETEVPIAIWDGLEEEDKICLMGGKKRSEISADDYNLIKNFDLNKLKRVENALETLIIGTGRGKIINKVKTVL